jgi:type IX secretion system PorP/SprF family membrane protein
MKKTYKIGPIITCTLIMMMSLLFYTNASAQLNPLTSQYFLNQYQVNPAYAGASEGLKVNLDYRKQWSNIPGSPSTQSMTADYKLNKVGIGINVFNEKAGSLQRTKAMATYAYHLQLNKEDQHLSFGASIGLMNERVDYNEINGDQSDAILAEFNNKGSLFDGDFGVAYTSKTFNLEAAIPNLRSFVKQETNNNIDRARFFAAVSYKINTGNGANALEIEPKVVFREIQGYKSIIDAGANFNFTDKLFIMGMYHSSNSASFGAGINYQSSLAIMAFYTTETAALQGSANGTFEVSLRARLFK